MDRRSFLITAALGIGTAPAWSTPVAQGSSRRAIPSPVASVVTRWDRDRWSRGSYSALPAGVSPSVRRTLADAIIGGRIALAGEYASVDYPATVHGAYLSGQHAASRLLDRAQPRTAIVVGAGMAGAKAARDLARAGVQVTVVEARSRVGGRIHSDSRWGAPVELGAAWIHGTTDNPVVPLARADGLRLIPTDYDDAVARDTVTGRVSSAAENRWNRLDDLIGRLESAWPSRSLSAGAWLSRKGWGSSRIDAWAAQVEITQEYALDADRIGVRAFEEGGPYRGGDVLVAGGYDRIPEGLLDGLDVRLNSAVTSVVGSGSAVTVKMASGRQLVADAVVVAVPLAILRDEVVQVSAMGQAVRKALRALATGNFEKVVLRYDEQWWGDHRVYGVVGGGAPGAPAGSLASLRWTEFYSLTDALGFPTLVGFAGGSAARKRPGSDAACVKEAVAALGAAFTPR